MAPLLLNAHVTVHRSLLLTQALELETVTTRHMRFKVI